LTRTKPSAWLARLRGGELGAVPVVIGIAAMAILFQSLTPAFLSPRNLSNLSLQIVPTGIVSLGIVLVLLLGEIDLSAGSVSGLCAAVMAVLSVERGLDPRLAILAAIALGAAIGAAQGTLVARLGVPSFVVTLAGLIGWQGALLYTLGETGTINLPYRGAVAALANSFVRSQVAVGGLALMPAVLLAVSSLLAHRRRAQMSLSRPPLVGEVVRVVAAAALGLVVAFVLARTRGVPVALLLLIALAAVAHLLLLSTRAGRHVLAVGGNAEAARRTGIEVERVRIGVFALASALAALGGVMQASRLFAVNQASGSGDLLLNAIAAAVIGGTSLFGGRGSPWSAVLGMLVIGSLQSGILLLDLGAAAQSMITGAVLLAAVSTDALARRGRRQSGRG
jgi:D-xylose transport system permease protein